MKILADQQIPYAKQAFSHLGDVELVHGRDINNARLADVDILLVRSITSVNESLLENTPVKFVGTATSGFDHIDQDYLNAAGIAYAYAPGSNARSVAEYVLSALFVLEELMDESIFSKRVGIIGYGHVGSVVAEFFTSLGMECVINDPPVQQTADNPDMFSDLEQVLATDIISLHVPYETSGEFPTQNLLDKTQLQQIKPGAILINTARGGVVNEQALLERLSSEQLYTIFDVWQSEPEINIELLKRVTIGTPHIAGYSSDGKLKATEILYHCACQFLELASDWQLDDIQQQHQEHLHLDEHMTAEDIIRQMVLGSYDIRSDAASLMALGNMPKADRGEYFDRLRKDYPSRYEFAHHTLDIQSVGPEVLQTLSRLGFPVAI